MSEKPDADVQAYSVDILLPKNMPVEAYEFMTKVFESAFPVAAPCRTKVRVLSAEVLLLYDVLTYLELPKATPEMEERRTEFLHRASDYDNAVVDAMRGAKTDDVDAMCTESEN